MPDPMPDPIEEEWELPVSFGVHGATGNLLPGIDEASFVSFYKKAENKDTKDALQKKQAQGADHLGVNEKVVRDPNNLAETGWGVIYSRSVTEDIHRALERLLQRRMDQAGHRYRIFKGEDCFLHSDVDVHGWLTRLQAGRENPVSLLDPVDPRKGFPYYLLIVAPPEDIPFEFQYDLSLQFAVGRIWFPSVAEFAQYADSLLRYEDESQPVPTARQAAIFAPIHDFDSPTQQFNRLVAEPFSTDPDLFQNDGFGRRIYTGAAATRDNLQAIFNGDIPNGPPALLFSGSHGMGFDSGSDPQARAQGAILCQDWPGYGEIDKDYYYTGADLPSTAKLHGMIHFFFACYSAGWPQLDNFASNGQEPAQIAPTPGLARLPQAMLAHPKGGALAVIGHIDRAWPHSFRGIDKVPQIGSFENMTVKILRGDRLGRALEQDISSRWPKWAAQTTSLRTLWAKRETTNSGFETQTAKQLANLWTAHDDARNYVIIGDPAVRLRSSLQEMPALPEG